MDVPLRNKDCSSKFRSKHSNNTVLCLLRNLLEQSLFDIMLIREFVKLLPGQLPYS